MTDIANGEPKAETLQFLVGFDELDDPDCGLAGAAAQQLHIDLRVESADRFLATRPGQAASSHLSPPPRYALAVEPHLKWLIDTVIGEMVGHYPAPFAVELRYPLPGEKEGSASLVRLDHPDAPAYSLSGTVVTTDLKQTVQEAGRKGQNLVVLLADRHQRFLDSDYGDADAETVKTNQTNRAANAGEVTGIYLTPALSEPSICISQYLPHEKGAILMLAREYQPVKYQAAISPAV